MVDGRGVSFSRALPPPPFVIYKYKYINIYPSRSFHPRNGHFVLIFICLLIAGRLHIRDNRVSVWTETAAHLPDSKPALSERGWQSAAEHRLHPSPASAVAALSFNTIEHICVSGNFVLCLSLFFLALSDADQKAKIEPPPSPQDVVIAAAPWSKAQE